MMHLPKQFGEIWVASAGVANPEFATFDLLPHYTDSHEPSASNSNDFARASKPDVTKLC
jgi:hypothetical protein